MTTPESYLTHYLLLPELVLLKIGTGGRWAECEHRPLPQPCPGCQSVCSKGYDRRRVVLKDIPLSSEPGSIPLLLTLSKLRLWCKGCQKPFTARVPGCLPGRRTTERFRRSVMLACQRYVTLKQVCRDFKISSDFAYRAFYEQLELKRRKDNQYPWPEKLGIDENCVGKRPDNHGPMFVTMFVNHSRRKLMEITPGKSIQDLLARVAHIPGRENVRQVTLDMSEGYRGFAKGFFPNAQLIADKFHVLKLLSHIILRERKKITGTNANRKARALLLCSSRRLDYFQRLAIQNYLKKYPRLQELYEWKERLHCFYRMKGRHRAEQVLEGLILKAKTSEEPEIKRLGNTLQNWKVEIVNYFAFGLTNARVEGFNNKASLVRRQAYGYRNINNYRLRVLSVCS